MLLSPSFSVGMALVVKVMNTGCARRCASSFAQIVQLLSHQTRECPLMLYFTKYVDVATLYSYGGCSKGKCLTWWRAAEKDQSLCYYFSVIVVSQASWEYPRLSKLFHTCEMCFSKFPAEVYREFPWLCGLKWIVSFTYNGYITLVPYSVQFGKCLCLFLWNIKNKWTYKMFSLCHYDTYVDIQNRYVRVPMYHIKQAKLCKESERVQILSESLKTG